jgi:hypothetical protein
VELLGDQGSMALVGSLWNQDVRSQLQRVHRHLDQQADEHPAKATRPKFQRRRPGSVLNAIVAVLSDHPQGMRVRDIKNEVETLLGQPVAKASVKSCLWAQARDGTGRFENLDRGWYRLRPERS